jgi:hypothetical protein
MFSVYHIIVSNESTNSLSLNKDIELQIFLDYFLRTSRAVSDAPARYNYVPSVFDKLPHLYKVLNTDFT